MDTLRERIKWALTKPELPEQRDGKTKSELRKEMEKAEKVWGNNMIGQVNNGNWTTKLGEGLVFDILNIMGENPRKPETKCRFKPDWETDNFIYEVKTSNWWVDGTAGEKVLGTWIKYQDIPKIYGKPLIIVCIARQEQELTYGKTKYFGNEISPKTRQILELAKSWGITYVPFSELCKKYNESS